jgi:tRNA (adenine57-N1/adenine58-N1)-methyltransferase
LAALKERHFADIQVIEIMHRYWKADPERLRPEDMMIGHTGYLIFAANVEAREVQ